MDPRRVTENYERREYRAEDVEDYFGQFCDRARNDFATFRQLKRPNMLWGWWTEEVARELQRFHRDLIEGRRIEPSLPLGASNEAVFGKLLDRSDDDLKVYQKEGVI